MTSSRNDFEILSFKGLLSQIDIIIETMKATIYLVERKDPLGLIAIDECENKACVILARVSRMLLSEPDHSEIVHCCNTLLTDLKGYRKYYE